VLAFLFVKDGDRFLPWVRSFVGPRAGGHLYVLLDRVWGTLGGFIRGQVLVSLCDGLFIGIGLLIVGVPLALPLAVLTFFGGFVPIVGALFAGALSVLVALVSNGFTAALIVLGIVLLVQQIEGNVLQPILQGKSLQLHAAVVLLAVTAGGSLYGIPGAFLAVPVTAAAAVVLRYLFAQVDRTSEDDSADAPSDPEAAKAVGLPPAPPRAHAPDEGGTAHEPRPDAPNPEQLELADDSEGLVPPDGPGPAVPAPRTANGDGAAGPVPEGTGSTARERS
jgi:putative heme transporter